MKAQEPKLALKKTRRWLELKGEDEVDDEVMDNKSDNREEKKKERKRNVSYQVCDIFISKGLQNRTEPLAFPNIHVWGSSS